MELPKVFVCFVLSVFMLAGVVPGEQAGELVPDFRKGEPNAIVCGNDGVCIQCSHKAAMKFAKRYAQGKWDGAVVFLPLNKKP